MSVENSRIREAVRETYGSIASSAVGSDCCGPETAGCRPQSIAPDLYDGQLLEGLPIDVTGLSLGCGDPVTIASLEPGETVLDLGSGGGIDCFLAERQVGEDGYIIGVDMTSAMIDKANANKEKLGLMNVDFRLGEIESLPLDDDQVDVVMSNCVINLSPDKPAVFREAFRVLKPGGRVSISDIVTDGEFSEEMRSSASLWAGCVSGAIDVEAYTAQMSEAGFTDVQVVDKVSVDASTPQKDGIPRLFSARITGYKPEA